MSQESKSQVFDKKKQASLAYVDLFLRACEKTCAIEVPAAALKAYKTLKSFPKPGEYPFLDVISISHQKADHANNTKYFPLKFINPTTKEEESLNFSFYGIKHWGNLKSTSDPTYNSQKEKDVKAKVQGKLTNVMDQPITALGYYLDKYTTYYRGLIRARGRKLAEYYEDTPNCYDYNSADKTLAFVDDDGASIIPANSIMMTSSEFEKITDPAISAYLIDTQFIITCDTDFSLVQSKHKDLKTGKLADNKDGDFYVSYKLMFKAEMSDQDKKEGKVDNRRVTAFMKGKTRSDGHGSFISAGKIDPPVSRDNIHEHISSGTTYDLIVINIDSWTSSKIGVSINNRVELALIGNTIKRSENSPSQYGIELTESDDEDKSKVETKRVSKVKKSKASAVEDDDDEEYDEYDNQFE